MSRGERASRPHSPSVSLGEFLVAALDGDTGLRSQCRRRPYRPGSVDHAEDPQPGLASRHQTERAEEQVRRTDEGDAVEEMRFKD